MVIRKKLSKLKCRKCGRIIPSESRVCPSCYGKVSQNTLKAGRKFFISWANSYLIAWLICIGLFVLSINTGGEQLTDLRASIVFGIFIAGVIFFILSMMAYGNFNPVLLLWGLIKKAYKAIVRGPRIVKYIVCLTFLICLIFLGNKGYAYAQVESKISQVRIYQSQEQFDLATETLENVVSNNPTRSQIENIAKLKKEIESQKTSKESYDKGIERFNANSWEEARDNFNKVKDGTKYRTEALLKIAKCTEEIKNNLRSKAVALAKKHNVYWGESWANRDKRSAEEILANYSEESLKEFIEKWENYFGQNRRTTIPKTTPKPIAIPTWTYTPISNDPPDYTNRIPEFENEISKCKSALEKAKSDLKEIDPIHEQHLQEIEEWYNSQPKVDHCRSCGSGASCCYTDQSDEVKAERKRRIDAENSSYFSLQSSLNSKISSIPNYNIPSIQWIIDNIKSKSLLSPPETYSYSACN